MRIIFCIFLMLTITGCSKPDHDRFHSEEYGFSIKFPAEWNIQKGYMDSVVRAENTGYSQGKVFQETINIVADTLPSGMSIDEYHTSAKHLMKETLSGLNEIESGTAVVNNREVYRFLYSYPLKPVMLKVLVYSINRNGEIFLITCMSEKDRFEEMKPVFTECMRSFEFK